MNPTRIVLWGVLVASLLAACSGSPITPEPTPVPTFALSEVLVGPGGFSPYADNPVLTISGTGSWDSEAVFNPRVLFYDGQFHMFYSGLADPQLTAMAIGYASSTDGFSFAPHPDNPILAGDGTGFDAERVSMAVPVIMDGQWVLYYNAGSGPGPGRGIGRATAPAPSGPWTRDPDPVLSVGRSSAWDSGYVIPDSVVSTEDGYMMYYTGSSDWLQGGSMIGMATSLDGRVWTKYDDPATTDPAFAASDPVLGPGPAGSWDAIGAWECTVRRTAEGWEMFYTGGDGQQVQIGYATSSDGIHWTKSEQNPVFSPADDPISAAADLHILQGPSLVVQGSSVWLYYDYGLSTAAIGVATR